MKQFLRLRVIVGCLVLVLATVGAFAQVPPAEFSLDDHPSGPPLNGPFVPPFGSAEDEFGLFGASLGPSPSLGVFGFFDSDILFPGPVVSIPFAPPPPGAPPPPVGLGLPFAIPNPVPGVGISDNVDGYNEFVFPMMMNDIYFALHPASAMMLGFTPALSRFGLLLPVSSNWGVLKQQY